MGTISGLDLDDVVLLKGKYVVGRHGIEVEVSVNQASIDRKLAIRRVNRQLEGRTVKSNTCG
jgi:hypothetical protein